MNTARTLALLLTLLMVPLVARAELPPGISGAWYDPAAPGHGVSVEILEGQRALVFWSVFDPLGAPLTLYTEARIAGGSIIGTAYAPRGMRFGVFDRAALQAPVWGTLRIDFSTCDDARLSYDANGPAGGAGYGRGEIELRRLTRIEGMSCAIGPTTGGGLPVGRYELAVTRRGACAANPGTRAAIDPDGRLWALESWEAPGDTPVLPGQTYVGCLAVPLVLSGSARAVTDARGWLSVEVRAMSWLQPAQARRESVEGNYTIAAPGANADIDSASHLLFDHITLSRDEDFADSLSRPLQVDAIAGSYELKLRAQFFGDFAARLEVDADGDLCFRHGNAGSGPCAMSGRLEPSFAGYGFFDFALSGTPVQMSDTVQSFRGRGWTQDAGTNGHALDIILVGNDDSPIGFGLVGRRP
jgi:hypothetical protein